MQENQVHLPTISLLNKSIAQILLKKAGLFVVLPFSVCYKSSGT